MQELAGDLVGEEWGDDRLLLSIKKGIHPNPGAECCVHAVLSSWAIVSECRLVPSDTSEVWRCSAGWRRGWCIRCAAEPQLSTFPLRFTCHPQPDGCGFLFVSFDNLRSSASLLRPYCALG